VVQDAASSLVPCPRPRRAASTAIHRISAPPDDFLAAIAKPATVPESVMTQAWCLAASCSTLSGTSSVK
jgi:hypothetical protein